MTAPTPYTPKTGARCSCKRGQQRDNCPTCEGTGHVIDFAKIHQLRIARQTLAMPDAIAGVMGGPTKDQARATIQRLTGEAPTA